MGNRTSTSKKERRKKKPLVSYDKALSSGRIQVLRLASLNSEGEIIVKSVDVDINDETFKDVGICSYTWGFDRTRWHDKETGLDWDVADRCEAMCRAALKFFPRVWIDGLCMVQAWPAHIGENMKIMGRLYWHGNVVPEMVLDKMALEYPLRGWVQQEISFTNVQYCITPLQKWFDDNTDIVVPFSKYIHEGKENEGGDKIEFPTAKLDIKSFNTAVNNSIPYFNVLSRATEGREGDETRLIKSEIAELLKDLTQAAFMYSSFGTEILLRIISLDFPLTGRLKREDTPEGLNSGALQSYRSGFFRFNTDREVAAFSLAAYVTGKPDIRGFLHDLESGFKPEQRAALTINGNPGRWCTGIAPVASLNTAPWPGSFEETMNKMEFEEVQSRKELDQFVSILYGCSEEHVHDNYDYVVGYKCIEKDNIHSCHFGVKKKESDDCPVRGLISANIPIEESRKDEEYYASYKSIMNQHLKMELGIRAIALLNSSWHVKSAKDPKMIFPTDSQTLRMLDLRVAPPFGDFTSPMKLAILSFLQALGCAAGAARDPTKQKMGFFQADWGDDNIQHVDL